MLPIILVAPHSYSSVPDELRDRYALSDYEIWKCSDPYTDRLDEFTCASAQHKADISRLVCDLNRSPSTNDAFHEFDFYGGKVFENDQTFTKNERENLLMKYWYPFHQSIADSIQALDDGENEVILLVDYHNTAGGHALNHQKDFMGSMILSNLGSEDAYENEEGLSISHNHLFDFKDWIEDQLDISVELNRIYRGGYNLYWYTHLKDILNLKAKIVAIQIEYNLDYIFNPIDQTFSQGALEQMQMVLNEGLIKLYQQVLEREGARMALGTQ